MTISASASGAEIVLIFDGGAIGNPGAGYGSFVVLGALQTGEPVRVTYPGITTNNQAEYQTMIRGLQAILGGLERLGHIPSNYDVAVLSDSMLVVEQVNGRWKVRKRELEPRVREALELLGKFGRWRVEWHPRSESVRFLGH